MHHPPFPRPAALQAEEAAEARARFLSPEGDHLTYLAVFRAFRAVGRKAQARGGGGGGGRMGSLPSDSAASAGRRHASLGAHHTFNSP